MIDTLSIRTAELGDSDEIARLCSALGYRVSASDIAARLQYLLQTDRHLVVVTGAPQSQLLGWVAAEHRLLLETGERVEIVGLIVDSDARRTGVGRTLIDAVESWTAARGVARIMVRSNIARNSSHRFYEGIGYEHSKTQHAYTRTVASD